MSSLKNLNQPLGAQFNPDPEGWDKNERSILSEIKSEYTTDINKETNIKKEKNKKKLPHQRKLDEIIFDVRVVLLKVIEMLLNKENPLPFILSEERNQFAFCILVITIGVIMLLFSNLLQD